MFPQTATPGSRKLVKNANSWFPPPPHPRSTESETVGGLPSSLGCNKPSQMLLMYFKFENHCHKWLSQDRPPGLLCWLWEVEREWQSSSNLEEDLAQFTKGQYRPGWTGGHQGSKHDGACSGLPWWSSVKNLPANAGNTGLTPGSGRPHILWSN